jgi:hypothetical protein
MTGLGMQSNHPGQREQVLLLVAFPCCTTALVQGECALAQGELAYVQGELLCEFVACGLVCLWWSLLFV